jgi:multisubunit Na+/H+ antiporter MnhG subunit
MKQSVGSASALALARLPDAIARTDAQSDAQSTSVINRGMGAPFLKL